MRFLLNLFYVVSVGFVLGFLGGFIVNAAHGSPYFCVGTGVLAGFLAGFIYYLYAKWLLKKWDATARLLNGSTSLTGRYVIEGQINQLRVGIRTFKVFNKASLIRSSAWALHRLDIEFIPPGSINLDLSIYPKDIPYLKRGQTIESPDPILNQKYKFVTRNELAAKNVLGNPEYLEILQFFLRWGFQINIDQKKAQLIKVQKEIMARPDEAFATELGPIVKIICEKMDQLLKPLVQTVTS